MPYSDITNENEYNRFIKYMNAIGFGRVTDYNFNDKEFCEFVFTAYYVNRISSMFEWRNLPDTIPQRFIELYLIFNGCVCVAEYEGKLYAFFGGRGGEPDVYYMPTKFIVANPALRMSKEYTIDEDCIVIPNDTMYMGLLPMISRYAKMMTETELSMKVANINSRILSLILAPDDTAKESAERYIQKIIDGDLSAIVSSDEFLGGITTQPYGLTGNSNILTNLIEFMQYEKASIFNELGLNANYNMKRESINSSESQMNNDALLPLIDDMLKRRQEGARKINEMFGTNIEVDFASAWKDNVEELEAEQAVLETQAETEVEPEQDPEQEPESEQKESEPESEPEEAEQESEPEEQEEEPEEESEQIEEELQDIEDTLQDIKDKIDDLEESQEGDGEDETE